MFDLVGLLKIARNIPRFRPYFEMHKLTDGHVHVQKMLFFFSPNSNKELQTKKGKWSVAK